MVKNNGVTQAEASRQFGVSRQLVNAWIILKTKWGNLSLSPRTGRPRKTTEHDNHVFWKMLKVDARLTATKIAAEYNKSAEVKISVPTIKRRILDGNLFGRRPSRKPLVSKKSRIARVKFAKKHLH